MMSGQQKKAKSERNGQKSSVTSFFAQSKLIVENLLSQRGVVDLGISVLLLLMFVIGYTESLRWPFPGPRATHGILKGLLFVLCFILVTYRKRLSKQKQPIQNLLMVIFVLSYVISAAFSYALDAAALNLWYPLIACAVLFAFSKVKLPKSFFILLVGISSILVSITFAFSFFSLMFRYSIDNIYTLIFLAHRATQLINELRTYGKYVSLGPYIMLAPICYTFLVQKTTNIYRKLLSVLIIFITLLTAVISNNRIDLLVVGVQMLVALSIFRRRLSWLIIFCSIPFMVLGLTVSDRYFGFNLEQRFLRPQIERDLETIDIRFTYWQTALYNFRNAPFFGTGPNSYNDISIFPIRRYYNQNVKNFLWVLDVGIGVHNIFIERLSDTGLFGFISFLALLAYFIRHDVLHLLKVNTGEERKVYMLYMLGSWSWILYGVTDNGYGAQGFVTFFFLRGAMNYL